MKYIKLFEDFQNSLEEGAIPAYPPGNPWKNKGSIQWTGLVRHLTDVWKTEYNATNFSFACDFDYDKYIADKNYRSVPMGTWKDKSLPKFLDKNPRYNEAEFDFVEVVENPEKKKEPWIKVADKKGTEFMIPPFTVLDVQVGSSIRDGIHAGENFLIDNMRGSIADYRDGVVYIKMQNGEKREYTLQDWKSKNYTSLDESNSENTQDTL